jgi:predicted nucleic acid-binding protein
MPRALVDTTVLFAAGYRPDQHHDRGQTLVTAIDDGTLPEGIVTEFVLAETLNGLNKHAGHEAATDMLDRLESNRRFQIVPMTKTAVATGKALFREYNHLSFVDACLLGYLQAESIEYIYSFDGGFDAVDDITRLETAVNPFEPK